MVTLPPAFPLCRAGVAQVLQDDPSIAGGSHSSGSRSPCAPGGAQGRRRSETASAHQINQDLGSCGRGGRRRVGLGERAQGPGVGDGPLLGDARLDAERGQAGAVAEVENTQGSPVRRFTRRISAQARRRLLTMLTTVTPDRSATTFTRASWARNQKMSAPVTMKLSRDPGPRFSSSSAIPEITRKITTPAVSRTARVWPGRKVTGRSGRGGRVGHRSTYLLQAAGVDGRGQDGAGADGVEVVHDPLGLLGGDHGADRDPAPRCAAGETVGDSRPGVSATAFSSCSTRQS